MNQADSAATNWGIRGLPDAVWDRLEREREAPVEPVQGDLETLMGAPASTAASPPAEKTRGRRILSRGLN
jgi:hypothetical protein